MEFNQIKYLFEGIEQKPKETDYRLKLRAAMKDMTAEQKQEVVENYNLGPNSTNEDYKNAYKAITGGI
jgi:hypothetical protein